MVYKWCVVPKCTNTSIKSPEKLFINVPRNAMMRKKWMQLARRNPNDIVVASKVFFCEDHFEMEKDIANYNQYKMGFSQRLLLANGALPSKFHCQQDHRKRSKYMARDLLRKKCAKCNITAAEDRNLSFHKFPLPGKHGLSRIRVWAEFCYPDKDWSSEKSLKDLHFQHQMICSKHFDDTCYTNSARTRLNMFAVPTEAQDINQEQTLSETKHDTYISVNEPQLDIMENDMELVKHRDIKKMYLEPNCSTLKQEVELDIGESSVASTSMSNIDTTLDLTSSNVTNDNHDYITVKAEVLMENSQIISGLSPQPITTDSRTKVSADQTSILCNFFEENPEVIRGYKRTPESMDKVQIKWKNITPHLNAVGPPRDHRSWAKYLCDMKAKLKRKSIKWRQSCNGKDPVMCNTDDFNEIRLRMLQVLRKNVSDTHESQDSHTSDLETGDDNNYHDDLNEGENYEINSLPEEIPDVKPKLECLEQNDLVLNYTPPPDSQPRRLVYEDEFDHFGKNVAEQLRTLPLLVALETQETLLSVLKKQRLKVLRSSDPLSNDFYGGN